MSNAPIAFYQSQLKDCKNEIKHFKNRSLLLSLSRLVLFLGSVFGVYFLSSKPYIALIVGVVGAICFFLILNWYLKVKNSQNFWQKKADIINAELLFLQGDYSVFENGEEFKDKAHFFSTDIDVFGEASFFQYINRTSIKESKSQLAEIISANNISDIEKKQNAIQELSSAKEWRLNFSTNAGLVEQTISHQVVFDWLANYQSFIPKYILVLSRLFSLASVVAFVAYASNISSYMPLAIVFFSGLFISSFFVKKINKASAHLTELKSVFSNYSRLIQLIEDRQFQSENCRNKKANIGNNHEASKAVIRLSKYLSALDQRNNILFAVFGNAFLLWDCTQIYKIENWIDCNRDFVKNWFKTITWFEAQNSLANFHFNHPTFVFPEIRTDSDSQMDAKQLGHFFIKDEKRICNDFEINVNGFSIITGSNMAGKSTFLRTVALAVVSANIGLPVCASHFKYKPIKLITSMRNTDSLKDDSSYFFAELVRLKVVVDSVEKEPHFIILDEILKGTNSKDKEEGSIKLMERLSKTSAGGLIATHDLALCAIEQEISNIKNQYFDAEIENNELRFDYTLKEGVCKNMNASFLLKKMQIV
ncbi:MAG: DNA mismatch repair protein MutS [Crocinitomicaceae bacterium]